MPALQTFRQVCSQTVLLHFHQKGLVSQLVSHHLGGHWQSRKEPHLQLAWCPVAISGDALTGHLLTHSSSIRGPLPLLKSAGFGLASLTSGCG